MNKLTIPLRVIKRKIISKGYNSLERYQIIRALNNRLFGDYYNKEGKFHKILDEILSEIECDIEKTKRLNLNINLCEMYRKKSTRRW